MKKKHVLKPLFVSMCLSFLFWSCNCEEIIKESSNYEENYVRTRSESIEWGSASCTLTYDGSMYVVWNYPSGSSEPCGMLFTLYSKKYGRIHTFETFSFEMAGNRTFNLSDKIKFEEGDEFWLQIEDSYNSPRIINLIEAPGGVSGVATPKCNHHFNANHVAHLKVSKSEKKITGSVLFDRPCRVIMQYSYYNRSEDNYFKDYSIQDPTRGIELTYNSISYMDDIHCTLRIYDLTCNKHIPQSDEDFNMPGNCSNYYEANFTIPGNNNSDFEISLEEIK